MSTLVLAWPVMRIWLALSALGLLVACAAKDAEPPKARILDAAVDGPEQRRLRRLTLCPVFDVSDTGLGLAGAVSVSGVDVCVDRARPIGGTWADWDNFDGNPPCRKSVAGENVAIDDVPELSELIVTLHREGYVPFARAVVTGPGDTDTTMSRFGCGGLGISRVGTLTWLDPGIEPSSEDGIIVGHATGLVLYGADGSADLFSGGDLYGAGVTIQRIGGAPDSGSSASTGAGPFFFFNGTYCPEASFTLAPTDAELQASALDAAAPVFPGLTGFSFARLGEGEYQVEVSHSGAFCRTWGAYADPTFGFPSPTSGVVAPVLPGHVTYVEVLCNCYARGTSTIDPRTCSTEGVPVRTCVSTAP